MLVEDRDPGPGFDPASPRLLRRSVLRRIVLGRPNFDVSSDGARVPLPRGIDDESDAEGPTLRILLDWFDEIERRIPGGR